MIHSSSTNAICSGKASINLWNIPTKPGRVEVDRPALELTDSGSELTRFSNSAPAGVGSVINEMITWITSDGESAGKRVMFSADCSRGEREQIVGRGELSRH